MAYLTPIRIAAPMVCGSFALNGLLRYQGLSLYGMIGLVTGALLNFLVAPFLIFVVRLGLTGAGIATAICQTTSFILLVTFAVRRGVITLDLRNSRPDMLLVREIIGGGMPSLLRQGAGSLATTCVNLAANPFGDAVIAAMAIVMRVMLAINSIIVGLGQGFQPVCGYNFGAGLYRRVKDGYWFCIRLSTVMLMVIAVLAAVLAPDIIALFRSDPQVVAVGTVALRIQCCTVPLNGFAMMSNMMQQTMGKTIIASFVAVCRLGLFLAPAVLILAHLFGVPGVQAAQSVSDIISFIVTVPLQARILRSLGKPRTTV